MKTTIHTVDIEGEICHVMQDDATDLLHVKDSKGRSWKATTIELLRRGVADCFVPPPVDTLTPVDLPRAVESPSKSTYGLVIFDYNGPDPRIPNVHAFGFMQTEDKDRGLNQFNWPIKGFEDAQAFAHAHWRKHFTYVTRSSNLYVEQHTFAYEPAVLIEHLFTWGVDMSKFDPTLPREA